MHCCFRSDSIVFFQLSVLIKLLLRDKILELGSIFLFQVMNMEDIGRPLMQLPTAAHTIWGLMAGQLLMSTSTDTEKLKRLIIAALVCLAVGYSVSIFTPVIKRISTTAFVFLSGGWTILALAVCYWVIDIKSYIKKTLVFTVVGVNPLFIYLFASVGGGDLFQKIAKPFTNTFIGVFSPWLASFILGLIVLFSLWYVCYWLYQKQIFIKI